MADPVAIRLQRAEGNRVTDSFDPVTAWGAR